MSSAIEFSSDSSSYYIISRNKFVLTSPIPTSVPAPVLIPVPAPAPVPITIITALTPTFT